MPRIRTGARTASVIVRIQSGEWHLMRNLHPIVAVFPLLGLLAACTPPTPQPTGIELRTVTGAEVQPIGVAFVLVAPSELPSVDSAARPEDLLTLASASEPISGLYVFGATIFDESGKAFVALPDVDDIPVNSLAVPSEAFAQTVFGEECSIDASDPAARVSFLVFNYLGLWPGFSAVTTGPTPYSITTKEPIRDSDWSNPDFTGELISFQYADRDVDVSTSGPDCSGIPIDLELTEGWNVLAIQIDGGEASLSVTTLDDGPLYISMPPLDLGF